MSPAEAVSRVNESVVVEMVVRRTKCCTGPRQVFLDSGPNHRDPKNLGVVVTEDGRAKFSAAAGVFVLVVSTFDTDNLLVKTERFSKAVAALQVAGHLVEQSEA